MTYKYLLTQNSELRKIGVYNWTLPALGARLPNGEVFSTCPQAGICAQFCYARNGTYLFPAVKKRHVANLMLYLDKPDGFVGMMMTELGKPRYRGGKWVRIHDSGDFFSDEYLEMWLDIARIVPDVTFYAYTKEVSRFKRIVERKYWSVGKQDWFPWKPANFLYLYSMGGKEDHLVNKDTDRHAEVFPSKEALDAAGYFDQEESDILAVTAPTTRIGIVANNIPHFNKKLRGRTFGSVQHDRDVMREEMIST
jgi:hypothetical protein